MTIPFPERIPLFYAFVFGVMLSVLLIMSGTGAVFAGLAVVFVVTSTLAFNIAGGLTRPSGSYVFFFAVLAVILGLVVKVVIWERVEVLLHSPVTTMGAYTGAMVAMLAAVYVSRRLSRKEGFLQDICSTENMGLAAIGCVVGGFGVPFLAGIAASTGSALLVPIASAFFQLNYFLNMAVILGTTYEIRRSGGRRSANASVYLATIFIWYSGVFFGFSKQALFTPPLCWLASCAALRYRFAFYQVVGVVLVLLFSSYYLVPFCQYGRGLVEQTATQSTRITTSIALLTHLGEVREKYNAAQGWDARSENDYWFFEKDEGFFDRLTMFGIDDALITVTDQKGTYGMSPYIFYVASFVPRIFWKNKPSISMGNVFAHEIGFNEEDTTTGISFTPVAEAYHEAKWFGVLVVEPILWIITFVILDSLCGDLRKSPWGILVLAFFAHIAPEGALQGLFYMMSYGTLIVLVVAYFSAYVMPLLASLVSPPKRNVIPIGAAPGGRGTAFANARPAPIKR